MNRNGASQNRKGEYGMSKSKTTKRGRPRKGDEYPVRQKPARECSWCGCKENFKSNRSSIMIGIVKVEWLRCQDCKKVTRFETKLV